jgi:hypothetical protein
MRTNPLAILVLLASLHSAWVIAQEASAPTRTGRQEFSVALDSGVLLSVKELRRLEDKGVMQLLFEIENSSEADTTLMAHGLALAFGLGDIAIIDFGGRKQYKMGYANGCLCSSFPDRDGGVVRAGETEEFWAWFGLPDAGVSTVAVQFPGLQPIMNVPVL